MSKRITITLTDRTYAELSDISRMIGYSKSAIASVSLSEPLHKLAIALVSVSLVDPGLFSDDESKRASGSSVDVLERFIRDMLSVERAQNELF